MTPAYQQSCKTALDYIPTGTKKQTTFNVTRRNAKEVVYLLPRREPDGKCDSSCEGVIHPSLSLPPKPSSISFFHSKRAKNEKHLTNIPTASGPLLVYMQEPVAVTTAAWWDIWAAGIAVYTMCIERGRGGTAFNLGELLYIKQDWRIDDHLSC